MGIKVYQRVFTKGKFNEVEGYSNLRVRKAYVELLEELKGKDFSYNEILEYIFYKLGIFEADELNINVLKLDMILDKYLENKKFHIQEQFDEMMDRNESE